MWAEHMKWLKTRFRSVFDKVKLFISPKNFQQHLTDDIIKGKKIFISTFRLAWVYMCTESITASLSIRSITDNKISSHSPCFKSSLAVFIMKKNRSKNTKCIHQRKRSQVVVCSPFYFTIIFNELGHLKWRRPEWSISHDAIEKISINKLQGFSLFYIWKRWWHDMLSPRVISFAVYLSGV